MNFYPQKSFIGLMEFISILFPGALFTWLLMGEMRRVAIRDRYPALASTQAWAPVLFTGNRLKLIQGDITNDYPSPNPPRQR
jgi:hypothetical protein